MSRAVPACCTCICRPMASAAVSRSFAVVSAIAALVGLTRAVCGERGQPIQLALGPAVFDRDVLALRVAGILEPLAKRPQTIAIAVRRLAVEEPDHRHRGRRARAASGHAAAAPRIVSNARRFIL